MIKIKLINEARMIFESGGLNISCYSKGYEDERTTLVTGYLETALIMLTSGISFEDCSSFISEKLSKNKYDIENHIMKLLQELQSKGWIKIYESV